ncbi:MAG: P-loop containing nucleoside triphosphate hydrolase protein [Monoraphidium minutum]|nr:MAG: P-loop containing nucleoside triphosphate hydrolase protein [Monoraphidium minutum]
MADGPAGLAMWLPCLVFAHIFAACFIVLSLARLAPELWSKFIASLLFWREEKLAAKASLPRARSSEVWRERDPQHVGPTLLLEWDGLGCEYNTPHGPKTVLKDVSGAARPYEMLALMGPSGAGKSTLLDILASRKSVGRLAGVVSVNGAPRGGSFARHVSYVPQEDTFLPAMTVGETCALHAALTLPRGTPQTQTAERIGEVLAAMGMLHARDTLVGGVLPGGLCLRGLSGGERKRVSVAVGILAAPSIIFLDEPTSGLDSCSALSVIEHLRDRARDSGLTIVASIHQPRAAVWALFDTCSLLSGGMLMYTGDCNAVVGWFESIGMGPWRSDVHGTACDWVMDLVNVGFVTKPLLGGGNTIATREDLAAAAATFAVHYRATHTPAAAAAAGAAKLAAPGAPAGAAGGKGGADCDSGCIGGDDVLRQLDVEAGSPGSAGSARGRARQAGALPDKRRRPTWWTTFRALLWREMLGTIRNPADVAGRMLLFAWMGVFCGLVFWRMGDSAGLDGARSRVNVLFIMAQQFLLMPYVYMSLYAADKRHYTADISARLYTPSPYYAAKTLAVAPFILLNVLVCTYVSYGMTGLRLTVPAVATNGAASVLLYLIGQQVQSAASIVMPNEDASFLLTIVWSAFNMYFSGFIVRFKDMGLPWLANLRYASAVNFTYSAYLRAEFSGAAFSCAGGLAPKDLVDAMRQMLPNTPQLRTSVFDRTLLAPGQGCVMDMDAVLEYLDMTSPVWVYLLSLAAYLVVMHGLTYLGLLLLARKERR